MKKNFVEWGVVLGGDTTAYFPTRALARRHLKSLKRIFTGSSDYTVNIYRFETVYGTLLSSKMSRVVVAKKVY